MTGTAAVQQRFLPVDRYQAVLPAPRVELRRRGNGGHFRDCAARCRAIASDKSRPTTARNQARALASVFKGAAHASDWAFSKGCHPLNAPIR